MFILLKPAALKGWIGKGGLGLGFDKYIHPFSAAVSIQENVEAGQKRHQCRSQQILEKY